MIKKHTKLLLLTFIVFLSSLITVNAQQMNINSIYEELDKYIESNEKYSNVTGAYIIGKHIFTIGGDFSLSTEDVMLAARTINLKDIKEVGHIYEDYTRDTIRTSMAIYTLARSYDRETDTYVWKTTNSLVGNSELPEMNDINYIDYNFVSMTTNTDKIVTNAVERINTAVNNESNTKIYGAYKATLNDAGNEITIRINKNLAYSAIENSDVVNIITNIIENSDKHTAIEITEVGTDKTTTTINAETTNIKATLAAVLGGTELNDLVGKSFNIKIVVADGVPNESEEQRDTYKISFVSLLNTNTLFADDTDACDYSELTCQLVEGENNCVATLDITDATQSYKKLTDLEKTITDALSNHVTKVTLSFGEANKIEITNSNVADVENIINTFVKGLVSKSALTYGDLLNKKINVKFTLANNYVSQNDKSEEEYTINVIANVNTDTQFADAIVGTSEANITFTHEEGSKEIEAIVTKDLAINKFATLINKEVLYNSLMNSKLFDTITITYGTKSIVLTDTWDAEQITPFLKEITGKNSGATGYDVVGKTITIEFKTRDGVVNAANLETNKTTYTITFVTTTDTKSGITKALTSAQGSKDVFEVKDLNASDTVFELDVKTEKLTEKLNNTVISGIENNIKNAIKAGLYTSIDVNILDQVYKITYTKAEDGAESFGQLTELKTILSEKTIAELRGSEITVTYNLAKGVILAEGSSNEYTIKITTIANTANEVSGLVDQLNSDPALNVVIDEENNVLTFNLKQPLKSVGDIVKNGEIKLADQFKTVLSSGLYDKVTITIDDDIYEITYNSEEKTLNDDLAKLIKSIEDNTLRTLIDKKITVKFTLANGITDQNETGKDIIYTVVLTNKIDVPKLVEESILNKNNNKNISLIIKNNTIYALYKDSTKMITEIFGGTGASTWLQDIFKDTRIKSLVLNINGEKYTIDKANATDLGTIKSDIMDQLNAVFGENSVSVSLATTIGEVQKILDEKVKITLTLNLVEGEAVDTASGNPSVVYNVKFSKAISNDSAYRVKTYIQKVFSTASFVKNDANIEVGASNKTDTVTIANITKEFKEILIGSEISKLTFNGVDYTSANFDTNFENALKAMLGVTDKEMVTYEELLNVGSISFTVTMIDGVLSENANQSETYTINFMAEE